MAICQGNYVLRKREISRPLDDYLGVEVEVILTHDLKHY